jgi:arylsulfatase A-like enzyme
MSRPRIRAIALLIAAASLLSGLTQVEEASADPPSQPPNIVVVVTDDQDSSSFNRAIMPHTFKLLEGGTKLSDFTIATPLCCPSRAAQLTGQYGHNNGVLSNGPGYQALRDPANVLPAWLQRAGYRTAHVGRFLNGYKRGVAGPAAPAPGWDRWVGLIHLHYRDYELSVDGDTHRVEGEGPRQYVTRDLHRRTNALLRSFSASDRPFFLQLDELAPHSDHLARGVCTRSALPGPDLFQGIRGLPGIHLPRDPTRERSVADKPSYIRSLPAIDAAARDQIQRRMRCRAAAIHEADRGVGRMVSILRRHGKLDRTVFVFYSDNGFFDGQHRIVKSKGLPYEESIQVPALIRVPSRYLGSSAPQRLSLPTSNIDIAPTLLDLAGAKPCIAPDQCRRLDGLSMVDALSGEDGWSPDRPILIEVDQRGKVAGGTLACSYTGVRTDGQLYVDYDSVVRRGSRSCRRTREFEHYRLDRDPRERHNLWPARNPADLAEQRRLDDLMHRLESCSGNLHQPPAWSEFAGGEPANPCQ